MHNPLEKIPETDKRYFTFHAALKLLEERNAKTIVETGTARCGESGYIGDGGSTLIYAAWTCHRKAELYSVDINPNHIQAAQEAIQNALSGKKPSVHFVCMDSIEFLKTFQKPIDFLYLDSYDFDGNDPIPSQFHHLREIRAAYPLLTRNSVVMIDDCDLPHGGKGALAIEYLVFRGWEIAENGYQVILTRRVYRR